MAWQVPYLPRSLNYPGFKEINFAVNDIKFSFDGIANAASLDYLNLDSTGLQSLNGIEQAPNLRLLHAEDNAFGGVFPASVSLLPNLEVLFLSGNHFGVFPDSIQSLAKLSLFACSRCGFSGQLPGSIGTLLNLQFLRLEGNSFSGPIPSSYLNLTKIRHLDISNQISSGGTGLTGNLPSFVGFPTDGRTQLE